MTVNLLELSPSGNDYHTRCILFPVHLYSYISALKIDVLFVDLALYVVLFSRILLHRKALFPNVSFKNYCYYNEAKEETKRLKILQEPILQMILMSTDQVQ